MGVVTHFANAEPSYSRRCARIGLPDSLTRMGRLAHSATVACMPTPLPSSGIPKWEVTACVRALRFTA